MIHPHCNPCDNLELKWIHNNEIEEINSIISICDDAFEMSFSERPDNKELLHKICKHACFLKATYDNSPCGYVAMYANDALTKTAYITLIGVRPGFQREGVGSKIIDKCVEMAKDKGMERIKLEVRNANKKALNFYIKNGFTESGIASNKSMYYVKDISS